MQGDGPFACEDSTDRLNLINSLMVDIVLSVLSKFCPNASGNLWGHRLPVTMARRNSARCHGQSTISLSFVMGVKRGNDGVE